MKGLFWSCWQSKLVSFDEWMLDAQKKQDKLFKKCCKVKKSKSNGIKKVSKVS